MNRPVRRRRPAPSRSRVPVARPAPAKPVAPAKLAVRPAAPPTLAPPAQVSLTCVPAHCDFDRVDSTSMFNTLGGIRALPSHEASAAIARRTLADARGYSRNDLLAIAEIGYHYLRSGGYKLAQVIFEGLTAVQPDEPYFWLALGSVMDRSGDETAARAAFEMTIQLDPKDATPEINLAELDLSANRRKSALRRLQIAQRKAKAAGQSALQRKAEAMVQLLSA
jgi:tetratricopeptide (TPR) repeat protein